MTVLVGQFRQRLPEYLSLVQGGEPIIVLRHGAPWVVVRPIRDGDAGRFEAVDHFRTSLARQLRRARRTPLVLTWRGRPVAVVARARRDVALEVESL